MITDTNIKCFINAPKYVNIHMYNDVYNVIITLNTSKDTCKYIPKHIEHGKIFAKQGKYYFSVVKEYTYNTSFKDALAMAEEDKRRMMIALRKAKIDVLKQEIYML